MASALPGVAVTSAITTLPAPAAADTITTAERTPITRNAINLTKAESKRLLKQLWSASSLEDTEQIASRLVELYNGKGLHVLSAVNAVASFPKGLRAAVDMLMKIIGKIGRQEGLDSKVFWASIRRSKGKFARQFKIIDKTLYCMAQLHHIKCNSLGRRMDPNPFELFDLTTAAWTLLLDHVPRHHIKKKYLNADKPRVFDLSRTRLVFMSDYHVASITAPMAAGTRLPQELVDMIANYMCRNTINAEVLHRITKSTRLHGLIAFSREALRHALVRTCDYWLRRALSDGEAQGIVGNVRWNQPFIVTFGNVPRKESEGGA